MWFQGIYKNEKTETRISEAAISGISSGKPYKAMYLLIIERSVKRRKKYYVLYPSTTYGNSTFLSKVKFSQINNLSCKFYFSQINET